MRRNMLARVTIDGRPFSGRRFRITNRGKILVDGVMQEETLRGRVELHIVEGVVEHLEVDGDVHCGMVGGNVDAGKSVTCGSVGGNVDAGTNVLCGAVGGNVDAGTSVTCGDVRGSIDAETGVTTSPKT
jgi:hypothetical protein